MKTSRLWSSLYLQMLLPIGLAGGWLHGEVYEVTANTAITLQLPVAKAGTGVYVRQGKKNWRKVSGERGSGRIRIELAPSRDSGDRAFVVIDPLPGLVMEDEDPPDLVAMSVDGKPVVPARAVCRLPDDRLPPASIAWEIADIANPLAGSAPVVHLDGAVLAPERLTVERPNPKRVRVTVDTRKLEYGRHDLSLEVADRAPLRNSGRFSVSFSVFDPTNVIRRNPGVAAVQVDSHYPGYPSTAPLVDGILPSPGGDAGNSGTWASAEDASPHWVELRLKAPVKIHEVTVYWAPRQSAPSRRLEIQAPDGKGGWRTVAAAPRGGLPPKPNVTLRFKTIETDRFRVFQPANGGSAERPGLMWIGEIEAR